MSQAHSETVCRSDTEKCSEPWSVEEQDACCVVRDRGGQALGYFYFEEEPGWRADSAR